MIPLKKLREIGAMGDISGPEYTLSCTHCPLYTATRATLGVKDCVTVVLGVSECDWYVANVGKGRESGRSEIFSVVQDWNDVTFGSKNKLSAAFEELAAECHPQAVLLVTTCVPEVVGDDVDQMAEVFSEQYGFPVSVVHTEHFKLDSEKKGPQNAWAACCDFMQEAQPTGKINVLGMGRSSFENCEAGKFLREAGVSVGFTAPECSVEELKTAAAGARLNLVTSYQHLLLAQRMKERFGIPYVWLEPHIDPERMLQEYKTVFSLLEKEVPASVYEAYRGAKSAAEQIGASMKGIKYFSRQSDFSDIELNAFLVKLGMKPLLIQLMEMPDADDPDLKTILDHSDPYAVHELGSNDYVQLERALGPSFIVARASRKDHSTRPVGFESITDFFLRLPWMAQDGTGSRRGDYGSRNRGSFSGGRDRDRGRGGQGPAEHRGEESGRRGGPEQGRHGDRPGDRAGRRER